MRGVDPSYSAGATDGCGSKPMVPFRGRCTIHFMLVVGFDWDVHWGYDLDFDPWPDVLISERIAFQEAAALVPVNGGRPHRAELSPDGAAWSQCAARGLFGVPWAPKNGGWDEFLLCLKYLKNVEFARETRRGWVELIFSEPLLRTQRNYFR